MSGPAANGRAARGALPGRPEEDLARVVEAEAKREAGSPWRRRLLAIPTPVIFLVCLLIAAVALWRQGSLASLGATARSLHPALVALVLLLYAIGPALQCGRWNALVGMVRGASDLRRASEVFLTSVIVNYAAPIGLAVPTRAALTARDLGLTLGGSGAVVLWEAVLDVGMLGLFSLGWLLFGDIDVLRSALAGQQNAAPIVIGLLLASGVAVVAVLALRPRLRTKAARTARDLATYPVRRPGPFLAALGCTAGYWLLQLLVMGLLLGAVGVAATPTLLLGLLGPPMLIGMLSPLPGGAGIREALMIAVAHVEGANAAAVLFAAVAYRAALFLTVPLLYGLVRLAIRRATGTEPSAARGVVAQILGRAAKPPADGA